MEMVDCLFGELNDDYKVVWKYDNLYSLVFVIILM